MVYSYDSIREMVATCSPDQRDDIKNLLRMTNVFRISEIPENDLQVYGSIIAKIYNR